MRSSVFFVGGLGEDRLLQANGIVPDGVERVGDVLETGQHGQPVLLPPPDRSLLLPPAASAAK